MGRLTLVLGGQKSGKSSHAAARVAATGRPVAVVTPAVVRDDEFAARVARHRADRPAGWRTIEDLDLPRALATAGPDAAVMVDALDTWLGEVLIERGVDLGDTGPTAEQRADAEAVLAGHVDDLVAAAASRPADTVVIAGQPGLGPHAPGRGARLWVDLHGLVLQRLAAAADEVVLMVAGQPLPVVDRAAAPVPTDLRVHGDTQVPPGAVDLAVNVQPGPPTWLADRLAAATRDLAAYPDDGPARAAAAARHGRPPDEALVVAGAAEAFWLLPRALRPRLAACVHPSFTEPEAALRAAGVPVVRVHRHPGDAWRLDPSAVPDDADLVVVGRPDNPTGVTDDLDRITALCRPGRTVVVDEAFAEFLPDASGLADRRDLPGLVCVRSLTKLWGLAGLRVGYVVGAADLVTRMDAHRQPWSTSTASLVALRTLVGAEEERAVRAATVADERNELLRALRAVPGVTAWDATANFVLLHTDHPDLRASLLRHGIAVRRGDTFPGLTRHHVRVAVRDRVTTDRLVRTLATVLEELPCSTT